MRRADCRLPTTDVPRARDPVVQWPTMPLLQRGDDGSIPSGITRGLQVLRQHASLVSEEDWVQFPGGPLTGQLWGRMYRGGEIALQANCEGFDSLRLH